jgi:hypothetical protein
VEYDLAPPTDETESDGAHGAEPLDEPERPLEGTGEGSFCFYLPVLLLFLFISSSVFFFSFAFCSSPCIFLLAFPFLLLCYFHTPVLSKHLQLRYQFILSHAEKLTTAN